VSQDSSNLAKPTCRCCATDTRSRAAGPPRRSRVELLFPVRRYLSRRTGRGLVQRVVRWRGQLWALEILLRPVVEEPVFPGLEAADNRVTRGLHVGTRMLVGRVVAASNVPTLRASAQVQPPAAGGCALHTAGSAGRDVGSDRGIGVSHCSQLSCVRRQPYRSESAASPTTVPNRTEPNRSRPVAVQPTPYLTRVSGAGYIPA
jgi:hypothetical protein